MRVAATSVKTSTRQLQPSDTTLNYPEYVRVYTTCSSDERMINSTRPILIGGSGSQRGSPMTRSPNGVAIVSHSLPADMHHVHLARFMTSTNGARASGLQPPRAPLVGSMPEPHFLQLESMPDLALGPPAETIEEQSLPPRAPAVVQVQHTRYIIFGTKIGFLCGFLY